MRSECALSSPGSPNALQFLAHSISVHVRTGGLSFRDSRSCRRHLGVSKSKTIKVFSRHREDTAGGDIAQIPAMREREQWEIQEHNPIRTAGKRQSPPHSRGLVWPGPCWCRSRGSSPADLGRQLVSGQYIVDQEQEPEPLLIFGSGASAENSSKTAQDPIRQEENMTLNQLGSWSSPIPATVFFFALFTSLFLDLHLHLRSFLGNNFPLSNQGTCWVPLTAHHITVHCVTAPVVLALILRQQGRHWTVQSVLLCPCLSYSPYLAGHQTACLELQFLTHSITQFCWS